MDKILSVKKVITIVICIYLLIIFLVYCGIFRDYTNPVEVTKYYFECLKNREAFLTYDISKPDFFDKDVYAILYRKYGLNNLKSMQLTLREIKDKRASVAVKILLKNGTTIRALAKLEHIDKIWLIQEIII